MTEETAKQTLIELVRSHVKSLYDKQPKDYVYHNFGHTEEVAEAALSLAKDHGLDERDRRLLEIAALFHDAAHGSGEANGHEIRGAELARTYLQQQNVPEEDIKIVEGCILATQIETKPAGLLEMILKDADYSHLAKKKFSKRSDLLRMEWELGEGKHFSNLEWLEQNISFLEGHTYYTTIARNQWDLKKQAHLKQLKVQLTDLEMTRENELTAEELRNLEKESRKYPRGVETMYRVTLRNHIQLSRIADNKANFLMSISGLILSFILGQLISDNNPVNSVLLPSIYFLAICLATMIFSILASRPNITKGTFSREGLLNKQVNILFFGNFHSMPLEEFDWGMEQLIKNGDLLYDSLTKDLYFLGKVLAKKYKYLRTAFNIFMFGLISTAIFYLVMIIYYM